MQIRVLNLDRSPARLAAFRAHSAHVPHVARVTAIDGSTLDAAPLIAAGIISPALAYSPGALGNAASHMMQWAESANTRTPLTILEDDALLCANFVTESARLLHAAGADWDFVQWGYNFDSVLVYDLLPGISSCVALFDQDSMRRGLSRFTRTPVNATAYRLHRSLGIPAYSISPAGAGKLLKALLPLRPAEIDYPVLGRLANASIDYLLAAAYPAMQAYVAVPPLALTANDRTQSTVQRMP